MFAVRRVERRRFLKWTGLAGTGLILGVALPGCGERETAQGADGAFEPNAFVQIDSAGKVTIWVSKSEMGQGVRTGLAMIVADELDAAWGDVDIRQADAAADDRYGLQLTGASLSIRTLWEPLRKAGATAREMLRRAAAQEWGVAVSECATEEGAVLHAASDRRAPYAQLVAAAAVLPVPDEDDVPLKGHEEFRLIGRRLDRVDNRDVVSGRAKFGLDTRVPGMKVAVVARCRTYGGTLRRLDASAAEAIPGVRQVVRVEPREQPFYLAAGVAVVADDTWTAMKGVRALDLEWEPGPHAGESSATLRERFVESAGKPGDVVRDDGNFDGTFRKAAQKVEAVYELPFLSHAQMEPLNCIAHVRAGGCEIWSPTQNPQEVQRTVAGALGLERAAVTVHVTLIGGGFGRRLKADAELEAALIAREVDAPVQVVWTREDDMAHDRYRPASYHVLRGGLDGAGLPTAWSWHILNTAADRFVEDDVPAFCIPNYRVEFTHVPWILPQGLWRATVNSQNPFVVHGFFDELARAGGRDPVDLWLRLLADGKERRSRRDRFDSDRMIGVLQLAAERSGWSRPASPDVGRGVAFFHGYDSYCAQVAEARVEGNTIRVERVVCAVDCGTVINPDLAEAQIEGAVVYGLNAALKQQITVAAGRVEQENFHDFPLLRIDEMPRVEPVFVASTGAPGGLGEPPLPPIAPAVANAVFDATGKRLRKMPFDLREV